MKYIITAAEQLGAGEEINLLRPAIVTSKKEAKEYITQLMQHKINILEPNLLLPEQWWTGEIIGPYISKSDGDRYSLVSPLHKIVAQISTDKGFVYLIPDNADKLWIYSHDRDVQNAISMLLLSAQAAGIPIEDVLQNRAQKLRNYNDLLKYVPDDDYVSMMIVLYAMQRVEDRDATFLYDTVYWENQPALILQTPTEDVPLALNFDFGYDKDDQREICDPISLYELTPMYRGIPSTIEGLSILYKDRVSNWQQFSLLMEQAMLEPLEYRDLVAKAATLVRGSNKEDILYMLMRVATKSKLIKNVQHLFDTYPCSSDSSKEE